MEATSSISGLSRRVNPTVHFSIDSVTFGSSSPKREISFCHHCPVQVLGSFLPEHHSLTVDDVVALKNLAVCGLLSYLIQVFEVGRGWTARLSTLHLFMLVKRQTNLI